MSSEWISYRLSELINIKHGFAFKGEHFSDDYKPYQLVTPGNFAIGGGFQAGKGKYYSGPIPEDYILRKGDVIVTMTDLSKAADTLGYAAVVPETNGTTWLHNQRIGLIQIKPNAPVDIAYLHYLMRSKEYRQWVVSSATGSTVKHTSPSRICEFESAFPPLHEQKEIASILKGMDDRITLLRETNATLEAIAQAMFKSWFVDFDPVHAKAAGREPEGMDEATATLFPDSFEELELGLVPKGWRVESIYKIADIIYGAPFASKRFNTDGIGVPLIRIRDLKDESPGVYTDEVHVKGYMTQPGDIIVGMDGEFRAYLWGGEPAWLNQRVCVFKPQQEVSAAFVHFSIKPLLAAVEASETATTVIHIGKNDIDRFRVVVPNNELLKIFGQIVNPIYAQIVGNKQKAKTLASLRDTLLPRLISGTLRLPEAGAAIKEVAA